MKNSFNIFLVLLFFSFPSFSQNKYPVFKTEPIKLSFPKFMEGCIIDSLNTKNDSLFYNLNGYIFKTDKGHIQTISEGFNGNSQKVTPWETLTELLAAYQKKDVNKIIGLYSANSQDKIKNYLTGERSSEFLEYLSKIKKVTLLLGFEYLNGYYAIIQTDYGIKTNYFIKENGQYKLSALDNNGPLIWNLSLYFKYKPEPLLKPTILTTIDTLKYDDNKDFSVKLNKKGNWLIVCENYPGNPVIFKCLDNYPDMDNNNKDGIITVKITGKQFFTPGLHSLYIVESNFPVTMVAESIIKNGLKKEVFIK